ncbi:hypothetical protein ACFRAM_28280 [Paenibacillus sp. NPDC056722]|uniref:hypothetical protein n=1 Tax=Paenibacillus sp. NPDC056722 TaxID=3345924 RepID=UPI0036BF18B7
MARLKDHHNINKFLEMEFIYRDNRPDQGCRFKIITNENGSNIVSDIGWTNVTLDKFIEMLLKFPMDFYDGYFSHYDESFEWKWIHELDTNVFLITIFVSGRAISYNASIDSIKDFGSQILKDISNTPKFDSK